MSSMRTTSSSGPWTRKRRSGSRTIRAMTHRGRSKRGRRASSTPSSPPPSTLGVRSAWTGRSSKAEFRTCSRNRNSGSHGFDRTGDRQHDADRRGTPQRAEDEREDGVDQPTEETAESGQPRQRRFEQVDETVQGVETELVGADEDDVPADPEHGEGDDDREQGEQLRHGSDKEPSEPLRTGSGPVRQMQTDVVHFDDEGDHTVDADRDRQGHDDENEGSAEQRLSGDLVEGDDHDLAAEDEVGRDRRPNDLLLRRGTTGRGIGPFALDSVLGGFMMGDPTELLEDLLSAFEAQIRAADHEQRGQKPGQELTEQQNDREDDDDLVDHRPQSYATDDRQLAFRADAFDELRSHRRIVNHDSGGLGAGARGTGGDIVEAGC